MIVDAYIDESGTHGPPHLIMGGMVGRSGDWKYFDKLWRKMLTREGIEYYHTKSMRDSDGPFVGWGRDRKAKLVEKCGDIQQRAIEFCFSTMLRYDEYLEHYKNAERPRKIQLDTMCGLCFRYCAIQIADLLKKTFKDKKLTLTFICEDGAKNFGQAKKIFDELKREEPFKHVFGTISTGGKKEHAGLQGADYVSHTAFLAEQDEVVKLTEFPAGADVRDARKIVGHQSPAFRNYIDADLLKDWKQRMLKIDAERIAYGQQKS